MTYDEKEAIDKEILEALRKQLAKQEKEEREKAPAPFVQYGWLCPACGRGNGPMSTICPCKPWPKMEVTC